MKKYITPESKKNEFRMLLKHPSYKDKVVIVVEGGSDVRLFRSLLDSKKMQIESVNGKAELDQIVNDLKKERNKKIFGLRDADHDRLLKFEHDSDSVFLTDAHDAEMMMLSSEALNNFVSEYSSHENHDILMEQLRMNLFEAAYDIGLVRYINERDNLMLNFKGINFSEFVSVTRCELSIDIRMLLEQLISRSSNVSKDITVDYLLSEFVRSKEVNHCKLQVCCGHDVTKLIEKVYAQSWASVDRKLNQSKIESALRLGYTKEMFSTTNLFKSLEDALLDIGNILTSGHIEELNSPS